MGNSLDLPGVIMSVSSEAVARRGAGDVGMCSVESFQNSALLRPEQFSTQKMLYESLRSAALPRAMSYVRNAGVANAQQKVIVPAESIPRVNSNPNVILPDSVAEYVGIPSNATNTFCNVPNFMNEPVDTLKTTNVQFIVSERGPALLPGGAADTNEEACRDYCAYVGQELGEATVANEQGDRTEMHDVRWSNDASYGPWPHANSPAVCRCVPRRDVPKSGIRDVQLCPPLDMGATFDACTKRRGTSFTDNYRLCDLPPPGEPYEAFAERTTALAAEGLPVPGSKRATNLAADKTPYGTYGNLSCVPWAVPEKVSSAKFVYKAPGSELDFAVEGDFTRCKLVETSSCSGDGPTPRGFISFKDGSCKCFIGNGYNPTTKRCEPIQATNRVNINNDSTCDFRGITELPNTGATKACVDFYGTVGCHDSKSDVESATRDSYTGRAAFVSYPCESTADCASMYNVGNDGNATTWSCVKAEKLVAPTGSSEETKSDSASPPADSSSIYESDWYERVRDGLPRDVDLRFADTPHVSHTMLTVEPSIRLPRVAVTARLPALVEATRQQVGSEIAPPTGYCVPSIRYSIQNRQGRCPASQLTSDVRNVRPVTLDVKPQAQLTQIAPRRTDAQDYQCGFTDRQLSTNEVFRTQLQTLVNEAVSQSRVADPNQYYAYGVRTQFDGVEGLYKTPADIVGAPLPLIGGSQRSAAGGMGKTAGGDATTREGPASPVSDLSYAVRALPQLSNPNGARMDAAMRLAMAELEKAYPGLNLDAATHAVVRSTLLPIACAAIEIVQALPYAYAGKPMPSFYNKRLYLTRWRFTPQAVAAIETSAPCRQSQLRAFARTIVHNTRVQRDALRAVARDPRATRVFRVGTLTATRDERTFAMPISTTDLRDHGETSALVRQYRLSVRNTVIRNVPVGERKIFVYPVMCSTTVSPNTLFELSGDAAAVIDAENVTSGGGRFSAEDDHRGHVRFEFSLNIENVTPHGFVDPLLRHTSRATPAHATDKLSGIVVCVGKRGVLVRDNDIRLRCLSTDANVPIFWYAEHVPLLDTSRAHTTAAAAAAPARCAQVVSGSCDQIHARAVGALDEMRSSVVEEGTAVNNAATPRGADEGYYCLFDVASPGVPRTDSNHSVASGSLEMPTYEARPSAEGVAVSMGIFAQPTGAATLLRSARGKSTGEDERAAAVRRVQMQMQEQLVALNMSMEPLFEDVPRDANNSAGRGAVAAAGSIVSNESDAGAESNAGAIGSTDLSHAQQRVALFNAPNITTQPALQYGSICMSTMAVSDPVAYGKEVQHVAEEMRRAIVYTLNTGIEQAQEASALKSGNKKKRPAGARDVSRPWVTWQDLETAAAVSLDVSEAIDGSAEGPLRAGFAARDPDMGIQAAEAILRLSDPAEVQSVIESNAPRAVAAGGSRDGQQSSRLARWVSGSPDAVSRPQTFVEANVALATSNKAAGQIFPLQHICADLKSSETTVDDLALRESKRVPRCRPVCAPDEEHVTDEKCAQGDIVDGHGVPYRALYPSACNVVTQAARLGRTSGCPDPSHQVCARKFPSRQTLEEQAASLQKQAIATYQNECNRSPESFYPRGQPPSDKRGNGDDDDGDDDDDEFTIPMPPPRPAPGSSAPPRPTQQPTVGEPTNSTIRANALNLKIYDSYVIQNVTCSPGLLVGRGGPDVVPAAGVFVTLAGKRSVAAGSVDNIVDVQNRVFLAPPALASCEDNVQLFFQKNTWEAASSETGFGDTLTSAEKSCDSNSPAKPLTRDALICDPKNTSIQPYMRQCKAVADSLGLYNQVGIYQCRPTNVNDICGIGTYSQVRAGIYANGTFDTQTMRCDCSSSAPLYGSQGVGIGSRCVLDPKFLCLTVGRNGRSAQDSDINVTLDDIVDYHTDKSRTKLYYQSPQEGGGLFAGCNVNVGQTKARQCVNYPSCVGVAHSMRGALTSGIGKCEYVTAYPAATNDAQSTTRIPKRLCPTYGKVWYRVVNGPQPGQEGGPETWRFASKEQLHVKDDQGNTAAKVGEAVFRPLGHDDVFHDVCMPQNFVNPVDLAYTDNRQQPHSRFISCKDRPEA